MTPFELVFKQEAILPTRLQHLAPPEVWDVEAEIEEDVVAKLMAHYDFIRR